MKASERKIVANRANWGKRGPLTAQGRERLRAAALRDRPWERATGPRTAEGKRRCRMNNLTHGRETAERRAWRRDALRFIRLDRLFRDALLGRATVPDPEGLVAEVVRLAQRLGQR